jgi:hypothetical protein
MNQPQQRERKILREQLHLQGEREDVRISRRQQPSSAKPQTLR